MLEHGIQNDIRNALAGKALIFRANVGQAWQGEVHRLPNGDILLKKPRPFSTGLPVGFSDLFGLKSVEVTQDMVGKRVGLFVGLEIKQPGKKARKDQAKFLAAVERNGGISGVADSVERALQILRIEQ